MNCRITATTPVLDDFVEKKLKGFEQAVGRTFLGQRATLM